MGGEVWSVEFGVQSSWGEVWSLGDGDEEVPSSAVGRIKK
jgi:hypothetical protein